MSVALAERRTRRIESQPTKLIAEMQDDVISQFDNEFKVLSPVKLEPLISVEELYTKEASKRYYYGDRIEDIKKAQYDKHIQERFDYLVTTRDLEIDSNRTKKIQKEVVDKMVPSEIKTRVVILRKGEDGNAFVTPDGTIFISQSLINKLDSYDELAAVLGHEISHLLLKTPVRMAEKERDEESTLGVEWIHEASCDQVAVELLEKANFNASAFATAIEKIQGKERGMAHQSGTMRATQSFAGLGVLDRKTSSNELTPLPDDFKKPVKKTNLELVESFADFHKLTSSQVDAFAAKLHPEDLKEVYEKLINNNRFNPEKMQSLMSPAMLALEVEIANRIVDLGFSKEQALLFELFSRYYPYDRDIKEYYFIQTPQDFIDFCEALPGFDYSDLFNRIHTGVFNKESRWFKQMNDEKEKLFSYGEKNYNFSAIEFFFHGLDREFYDKDLQPEGAGIPFNRIALIEGFKKLSQKSGNSGNLINSGSDELGMLTARYVLENFVKISQRENRVIDPDEIMKFLREVKDTNVYINGYYVLRYIESIIPRGEEPDKITLDLIEQIKNLYGIEPPKEIEKTKFDFADIDKIFDFLSSKNNDGDKAFALKGFMSLFDNFVRENRLSDEQISLFAEYVLDKIYELNLSTNFPLTEFIKNPSKFTINRLEYEKSGIANVNAAIKYSVEPEDNDLNQKYANFYLATVFAPVFFRKDGEGFYSYLNNLSERSGIDFNSLTGVELANLCRNIFFMEANAINLYSDYLGKEVALKIHGNFSFKLNDYTKLFELPFMQSLVESSFEFIADSFEEFNKKSRNLKKIILPYLNYNDIFIDGESDIYGDSLPAVFFGRELRTKASDLLREDLPDAELRYLAEFLRSHYPGQEKDLLIRDINKKYLNSPNVSLEEKIDYLRYNIERLGVEGIVTVAEQIDSITDFRDFKYKLKYEFEKYLNGSKNETEIAGADFMSSYLAKHFGYLFNTAIETDQNKIDVSTDLAEKWFQNYFGEHTDYFITPEYDKDKKRFAINNGYNRDLFRSVRDHFGELINLSDSRRAAMVLKLLVDQDGGLTSIEGRGEVANYITKALSIDDDFLKAVINAAALESDAKLVAFPAAQILAPLIFRALDTDAINTEKVAETDIPKGINETTKEVYYSKKLEELFPREDIAHIVSSVTRDIKIFGPEYVKHAESAIFSLAQESDISYEQLKIRLREIFGDTKKGDSAKDEANSELPVATEALIKAVEISGALGVRALQLISQFEELPPVLDRRLAQSFDSNHGMEKLRFWMNLEKLASENSEIEEFVQRISLGQYLGGGSLQTTYQARYTSTDGTETDVVLKLKNPNVELFVDEVYQSSRRTLEKVISESSDSRSISYAKTGLMLLDLSKAWCKADIRTINYEELDDRFRTTIDSFNVGDSRFYAPTRVMTHPKLKVETLGEGVTVNKYLQDENVSSEEKREVVGSIAKFFLHQLKAPAYVNENGEEVYLAGSDPHVGNFLVDANKNIGVIDRDYYLEFSKPDVELIRKLIYGSSSADFAKDFVDRLLEVNKVRGLQKQITKTKILGKLGIQIAKGEHNNMQLLRTILSEFTNANMEVPIEIRIMIRNVEAFKKLCNKYSIDLSQIV